MSRPWMERSYVAIKTKTVTVTANSNPARTIDEYVDGTDHQVLSCGHERDIRGFSPAGTLTLCHAGHENMELDWITQKIINYKPPDREFEDWYKKQWPRGK